jgi:hypothetical protein
MSSASSSLQTFAEDDAALAEKDDLNGAIDVDSGTMPEVDLELSKQQQQQQQQQQQHQPFVNTPTIVKESFEIEMDNCPTSTPKKGAFFELPASPSRDEDDAETQGLLLPSTSNKQNNSNNGTSTATASGGCTGTQQAAATVPPLSYYSLVQCSCCRATERVGNMTIFWPSRYYQSGWGIRGPDWFGPPCVWAVLTSATAYLVRHAMHDQRPVAAAGCVAFLGLSSYYLANAAYRDPGVILIQQRTSRRRTATTDNSTAAVEDDDDLDDVNVPHDYRWCDFCRNYQPPDGAHCRDCNVCIAGFDHHCVWMGTCIGRNNFRQFLRFNLAWLAYLLFAVVFVLVGPALAHLWHHYNSRPA